jgi:hypothetical protein
MAVPAAAMTRIQTFLTNVAAAVATKQATYFAAKGRYWQGRRCLLATPADGATAAPVLTDHPTDQVESWADLGLNPGANLEVNLWCDTYIAPGGPGYVLGVEVWYSGQLWRRTQNFQGPESWRTTPWTDVTPVGP